MLHQLFQQFLITKSLKVTLFCGENYYLNENFLINLRPKKFKLKEQWQILDILQGASSLGVKFTRKILAWYDK